MAGGKLTKSMNSGVIVERVAARTWKRAVANTWNERTCTRLTRVEMVMGTEQDDGYSCNRAVIRRCIQSSSYMMKMKHMENQCTMDFVLAGKGAKGRSKQPEILPETCPKNPIYIPQCITRYRCGRIANWVDSICIQP